MSTNGHPQPKVIRCAIYTRKSTSEGLEQEFSSLDAQREACQSYIASQKGEGWVALPDQYDDGGFTGANLDRPALQKLLTDIREGRIDCVVVYKVDRLSRSLLDFTRLLELFEQHAVTFVSVTQAFNTNSSMGRLTLNILLSFAQFERELISERTKDKMAAARKKGKWVGGQPILGYTVETTTKRLIINEQEAGLVRQIFERYLQDRSLLAVTKWLNGQGHTTKQYVTRKGRVVGGIPFKITHVQAILKNVLYTGQVAYNGQRYPPQHDPILSEELFAKAQAILAENRQICRLASNTKQFGLLMQRLACSACQCAMCHTYTAKDHRRYLKEAARCRAASCAMARGKTTRTALLLASMVVAVFVGLNLYTYASQQRSTQSPATSPTSGALVSVVIPVEGMTCFTCKLTVESSLKRLPGVESADANVSEQTAHVRFDPSRVSLDALIAAINKTGYHASQPS